MKISDWLIVPFIVLLVIAPSARYEQRVSKLDTSVELLGWALLSILSIHFRYRSVECFLSFWDLASNWPSLRSMSLRVLSRKKTFRTSQVRRVDVVVARGLADAQYRLAGGMNQAPNHNLLDTNTYNAIIVSVAILYASSPGYG